ncbi:hypothetical protein BN2537_9123 [Streptomyces venezuelae]|nr:hypothetical protein BN2537_9123 [Streptomyces venezuelae]
MAQRPGPVRGELQGFHPGQPSPPEFPLPGEGVGRNHFHGERHVITDPVSKSAARKAPGTGRRHAGRAWQREPRREGELLPSVRAGAPSTGDVRGQGGCLRPSCCRFRSAVRGGRAGGIPCHAALQLRVAIHFCSPFPASVRRRADISMRTADTAWSSPGSCPGDHSFSFSRGGRKTWPLDGNGTDMNRPGEEVPDAEVPDHRDAGCVGFS